MIACGVAAMNYKLSMDPLTGMENLFGLLETDIGALCGTNGTIIFLDLVDLMGVNERHGRHIGDVYIKTLAEIIKKHVLNTGNAPACIRAFRYGGDEFIVILPDIMNTSYDAIFSEVNRLLREEMLQYGIEKAGIYWALWIYEEPVKSMSHLLKQGNLALWKAWSGREFSLELPCWADDLIDSMLIRVRETLALLQQANSLALMDDISGLSNYRSARLYLQEAYEEFTLFLHPFSILFIDGDNLKRYNNLGYDYGNEMIRKLGSLVTGALRTNDRVFRWLSGDEFVVVLKQTPRTAAVRLAERIRATVETETKEWRYPITVSIGVANCPEDGTTLDALVARAETANASAKNAGKNRVV